MAVSRAFFWNVYPSTWRSCREGWCPALPSPTLRQRAPRVATFGRGPALPWGPDVCSVRPGSRAAESPSPCPSPAFLLPGSLPASLWPPPFPSPGVLCPLLESGRRITWVRFLCAVALPLQRKTATEKPQLIKYRECTAAQDHGPRVRRHRSP